jgi:hypothetical protein
MADMTNDEIEQRLRETRADARIKAEANGHQMGIWRVRSAGQITTFACECATCGASALVQKTRKENVRVLDDGYLEGTKDVALFFRCPNADESVDISVL